MNSEIGQLEGKRIKTVEIMIERKAQLGNRSAGWPRTTAANCGTQRLDGKRFEPDIPHRKNVRQIVKEKLALQTGPVDAEQHEAAKHCQNKQLQKFAQTTLKKKKPLGGCQGALLKPDRLEVLAGARQVLAGQSYPYHMSKQPYRYLPYPMLSESCVVPVAAPKPRSVALFSVTIISPVVAPVEE